MVACASTDFDLLSSVFHLERVNSSSNVVRGVEDAKNIDEPTPGGEVDKELKKEEPEDSEEFKAKLKAFADLLVLRFFSATPGLVTYMINSGVVDNAVEFSFWRLPNEVIEGVKKVSGCRKVEVYKFYDKGAPCTGFRFFPEESDLADFEIGPVEEPEKPKFKVKELHAVKGLPNHTPTGGASAVTKLPAA